MDVVDDPLIDLHIMTRPLTIGSRRTHSNGFDDRLTRLCSAHDVMIMLHLQHFYDNPIHSYDSIDRDPLTRLMYLTHHDSLT